VLIVLAYLGPLAVVPLVLAPTDREIRWHAKHGLVLLVAELLLRVTFIVATALVSLTTAGLGWAMSMVMIVIWVAILAVHLVAIIKAIGGTRLMIPGVSHLAGHS
jgi:uncharacterized membrane protein